MPVEWLGILSGLLLLGAVLLLTRVGLRLPKPLAGAAAAGFMNGTFVRTDA